MSNGRSVIAERIAEMARPIAARRGLDVVDVEVLGQGPRTVVRVVVEGGGRMGVDDLARVSHALSSQLDTHDLIPHAYRLELASPGLDRPLRGEADFVRFAGRSVEVWIDPPLGGRRHFRGRLLGVRGLGGREVELALGGGPGAETVRLPREQVTAARLIVDEETVKQDLAQGGRRDG